MGATDVIAGVSGGGGMRLLILDVLLGANGIAVQQTYLIGRPMVNCELRKALTAAAWLAVKADTCWYPAASFPLIVVRLNPFLITYLRILDRSISNSFASSAMVT